MTGVMTFKDGHAIATHSRVIDPEGLTAATWLADLGIAVAELYTYLVDHDLTRAGPAEYRIEIRVPVIDKAGKARDD